MLVTELGLEQSTLWVLSAAAIRDTTDLKITADKLLAIPDLTGEMLCEIVCALNRAGMTIGQGTRQALPTAIDREILVLRAIDGFSFAEIAAPLKMAPDEVKEQLRLHFGLYGTPPSRQARIVKERRKRIRANVIVRLKQAELANRTITLDELIAAGAIRPPSQGEARIVISEMLGEDLIDLTPGNLIISLPKLRKEIATILSSPRKRSRGPSRRHSES